MATCDTKQPHLLLRMAPLLKSTIDKELDEAPISVNLNLIYYQYILESQRVDIHDCLCKP